MSTLKVDNLLNSAGNESPISVPGAAKAWVNFDGTGTVAIRDSFNVDSITDHAVGQYGVNFSNNFSNTDYCPVCTIAGVNSQNGLAIYPSTNYSGVGYDASYRSTSSVRVLIVSGNGTSFDNSYVTVAVYGD